MCTKFSSIVLEQYTFWDSAYHKKSVFPYLTHMNNIVLFNTFKTHNHMLGPHIADTTLISQIKNYNIFIFHM